MASSRGGDDHRGTDSPVFDLVDTIKTGARSQLLDLLDDVTGRKVLVLDSTVTGPLDFVVSTSDLKDHGVLNFYKLSETYVESECAQMIFMVRCVRVELMDLIAKQILEDEARKQERMYEVILIPRKTEECMERLARGNVRANVRVVEFGLHFFPFDRDVLSMEAPGAFHDFHVQGDPTALFYAAKGIMSLQSQFGLIPDVHVVGSAAKAVLETMLRLQKEQAASEALKEPQPLRQPSQPGVPPVAPHARQRDGGGAAQPAGTRISEIVLMDRRVDVFSVLCSQFTYQALIDMAFGIRNNNADISSVNFAKDQKSSTIRLSGDDPFYVEIRDLHIDKLGPLLQEKAMAIQKTYAEKDNIKNPAEMQEYIKKFKTAQSSHSSIETHINLAHHLNTVIQDDEYRNQLRLEDEITATSNQAVLENIEDYMDDQRPFHEVMRLLCLFSLANNGIKPKQLDQLKRYILQSYGYEHLITLNNLDKVGLLRYQGNKSVWPNIKRYFNLFVEDNAAEKDICYAYSGYAPLSVRLVQMTKSRPGGWRACKDALSLLWGPAQDLRQVSDTSSSTPEEARDPSQPSVVLVVFLGGCTYGEIAALRRLSELEEGRRKFLILTTEFINTKKLFESMRCEQVFKQPVVESKRAKPEPKRSSGGGFFGALR